MILRILCCAILQFCIIGYAFGVVPQITRLNVQCDRTGMKVNVEFDNPFNGIIFSKGHYSDPNCRWVASSSSRRQFNFYIGTAKCGTIGTDMAKDSTSPQGFKNVIIIQNDPDYQEVWDSARKLSCDWVTRLEKYVTFAPFGVDMLGVKELRFPGDTVDCWMDIQRGHGPFAPSVGGVVPIGEKLTVVIYVRDTDSSFDVHVKDCYAYDSSDYRNPDARAIKLTDERGCPLKEKLVQGFYRTRDVRTSGATIIAYGIVNAFKFPERMDVFLACNVEVCKGTCPNNDCQPEVAVAGSGEEPTGSGGASGSGGSTTSAPSTGDDEEETDDKKEEDKATGDGDTSSTTEATDTEDTEDSGTGSTTEDAESSEDTSEKPKTETEEKEEESKDDEKKDEEKKEDETKDEESKDDEKKDEEKKEEETKDEESKDEESKDEESKDEDKKDEDKKDEESKDEGESKDKEESKDTEEDKSDSEDKKDEKKDEKSEDEDTEKTKESASEKKEETAEEDKEQTKESKSSSDDEEDADSRKAARIRLAKKKGRKAKKADVITPRKRSAKRPSRKGTTASTRPATKPKSSKLKKQTIVKQVRVKKLKPKTKPKSADLRGSSSIVKSNKRKVKANIIRAPSSIPAAFSRQRREKNLAFNDMFQRQGRHIRSRRSVTVLGENATFPAMMHSISIISPIEDLDEKELEAWEKMIEMEGKSEEVSVFESITKLPLMNGEGAYCFSVVSLMSASALLAAIVMIISLSVAMVCSHLHARSSAKAVDLY